MPDTASNEIHLRHLGKPLGSIFLGVAIVVLIVGGRRYFEGQVSLSWPTFVPGCLNPALHRSLVTRVFVFPKMRLPTNPVVLLYI